MISQCERYATDPMWLTYADWAERHFVTPSMTEGEKSAMRAGLALGYDMGRRDEELSA